MATTPPSFRDVLEARRSIYERLAGRRVVLALSGGNLGSAALGRILAAGS